jgi:hypothetical protein
MITAQTYGYKVDFRATPITFEQRKNLLDLLKDGARAVIKHIGRNKVVYQVGAMAVTFLLVGGIESVFAAPGGVIGESAQSISFDQRAGWLYRKLTMFAKWVIIIKGGFDTISHTVQGDFPAARKAGLSYLLVYVILLGLPWAFSQVEGMFNETVQTMGTGV